MEACILEFLGTTMRSIPEALRTQEEFERRSVFMLTIATSLIVKLRLDQQDRSVVWQVFGAHPQDVVVIDQGNGLSILIIFEEAPSTEADIPILKALIKQLTE